MAEVTLTVTKAGGNSSELKVIASDSLDDVRNKTKTICGLESDSFKLFHEARELSGTPLVSESGLQDGDLLTVVLIQEDVVWKFSIGEDTWDLKVYLLLDGDGTNSNSCTLIIQKQDEEDTWLSRYLFRGTCTSTGDERWTCKWTEGVSCDRKNYMYNKDYSQWKKCSGDLRYFTEELYTRIEQGFMGQWSRNRNAHGWSRYQGKSELIDLAKTASEILLSCPE